MRWVLGLFCCLLAVSLSACGKQPKTVYWKGYPIHFQRVDHLLKYPDRAGPAVTLLNDGNVLIVGGRRGRWDQLDTPEAELFNPKTLEHEVIPSPNGETENAWDSRIGAPGFAHVKLADGRVLYRDRLIAFETQPDGRVTQSAGEPLLRFYNPATKTFSVSKAELSGLGIDRLIPLKNGDVLLLSYGNRNNQQQTYYLDIETETVSHFSTHSVPDFLSEEAGIQVSETEVLVGGGVHNYPSRVFNLDTRTETLYPDLAISGSGAQVVMPGFEPGQYLFTDGSGADWLYWPEKKHVRARGESEYRNDFIEQNMALLRLCDKAFILAGHDRVKKQSDTWDLLLPGAKQFEPFITRLVMRKMRGVTYAPGKFFIMGQPEEAFLVDASSLCEPGVDLATLLQPSE